MSLILTIYSIFASVRSLSKVLAVVTSPVFLELSLTPFN